MITDNGVTRLYADINGRVCCAHHVGAAAQGVLRRRPNAKSFETELTKWYAVTKADLDYGRAQGFQYECESCGARMSELVAP